MFFVFNVYDPRYLKCNIKGLYKYHQGQQNPGSVRTSDATGTIEFRQHAGTTDWEKISSWVSFCYQIVESSRFAKCDALQSTTTHVPFERKKRRLFDKIGHRLKQAFSSKEEFEQHYIFARYRNARKFLVKRITHFTNNGTSVAESNLINRTNLNREGGDNV